LLLILVSVTAGNLRDVEIDQNWLVFRSFTSREKGFMAVHKSSLPVS